MSSISLGTFYNQLTSIFNLGNKTQITPSVINVTSNLGAALTVTQNGTGAVAQFTPIGGSNTMTIDNMGNAICAGTVSSGTGMMFRNRIINGDMRINQRGTSTNLASMTAVGATYGYVADRWGVFRGLYNAGAQMAQGTNLTFADLPFSSAGIKTFARVSRISGNTSTAFVYLSYALESQDSYPLIGKNVTVSFYYRTGTNFSGTNLDSHIQTGTGTDEGGQRGTPITGYVDNTKTISSNINWTYAIHTVQLGNNINQVIWSIGYTPSGTAGANDYFDITGVQLEKGTVATPFEYRPYATELALCQRYYQKNFYGTTGIVYQTNRVSVAVTHKQTMRSNPVFETTGNDLIDFNGIRTENVPIGYYATNINSSWLQYFSTANTYSNGQPCNLVSVNTALNAEL